MIRYLWTITRGYRFRPWRSPYLRWRIETYEGWHAERITLRDFWKFAWSERRELRRFLKWAAKMAARSRDANSPAGPDLTV